MQNDAMAQAPRGDAGRFACAKGLAMTQARIIEAAGALAVAFGCGTAAAQPCDQTWLPTFGIGGVNGEVNAISTWDSDGDGPKPEWLVIGGEFTLAGGAIARHVAAWDGTTWHALGDGLGVDSPFTDTVLALASFNGELIAGGQFSASDASGTANIARWDGTIWQPMGDAPNGPVRALMVYQDQLIAGGSFSSIGGVAASAIARWDGTSWHEVSGGMSSPMTERVDALAVFQGELIATGYFEFAGGVSVSGIASWDGAAWSSLDGGLGGTCAACLGIGHCLMIYNDELMVGGNFSSVGGDDAINWIARWNGREWNPLGTGTSGFVQSLTIVDGDLIVAGGFTYPNDADVDHIARWDGTSWHTFPADGGSSASFVVVGSYAGALIVGTQFGIGQWDGTDWSSVGDQEFFAEPEAAVMFEGDLVIGSVSQIEDLDVHNIARWDGTTWSTFGAGVDGGVSDLIVHNGLLLAARDFLGYIFEVGFPPPPPLTPLKIAAWDGENWSFLGEGLGGTGPFYQWYPLPRLYALASYDGAVIAGGTFFNLPGQPPATGIARWDGRAWQPLTAGILASARALTVYNDELIVVGSVSIPGVEPTQLVARWDGLQWHPFVDSVEGDEDGTLLWTLGVHDGDLILGGRFIALEGISANNIARWDGVSWSALGEGTDHDVYAVTSFGGDLIAGGYFLHAGGVSAKKIARWDGSQWSPLDQGITFNFSGTGSVDDMAVVNGQLHAVGYFNTAGDHVSHRWARWGCKEAKLIPADLNHDGVVDGLDFAMLLSDWGPCAGCDADLTRDGIVNGFDLAIVLAAWGPA